MKDLFTLNDDGGSTETCSIFSQLSEKVNVVGASKDKQEESKSQNPSTSKSDEPTNKSESKDVSDNMGDDKAYRSDTKADEETNILQSLFDAHGIHVSS